MPQTSDLFFTAQRRVFFRPLAGKYRELVVTCLRELYRRTFSASDADYGQALSRDVVLGLFQEVLTREQGLLQTTMTEAVDAASLQEAEAVSGQPETDDSGLKTPRDQALWVLNQLLECGWLEKQVDQASLQSSYGFTREGRDFTEPFAQSSRISARTRHRNTRNTRNALESFLNHGDVYDLLDAHEHSERIITDFTDVIAELDERKRNLVREMESQWQSDVAGDAFFDFMENRFQPDLSVRLSADNVEKHRHFIEQLLGRIRTQDDAIKAGWERRLRELLPELAKPGQSLLWWLLDGIEHRLRNACDIMLPALRQSLQGFTRRADIVIRQMGYLASQRHNDVPALCQQLAALSVDEQEQRLQKAAALMSLPDVGLVDPAQVRLAPPRERRVANAPVQDESRIPESTERKQLYIQQALDQAFTVNQSAIRDYVETRLVSGGSVSSREFPVSSAREFLAAAHAIGLGAANADASTATTGKTDTEGYRLIIRPESEVLDKDCPDGADRPESDVIDQSLVLKDAPAFVRKDHFVFELVQTGA